MPTKKQKMLYPHSLAMATASSDNDIMLTISYYINLNKTNRLVYIYKIRKSSTFNNAEQFFSYRKNIARINLFKY